MKYEDLYNPQSESGLIATLIHNPTFLFQSDELESNDFFDQTNQAIFWAIKELVHSGIYVIDDFSLNTKFSSNDAIESKIEKANIKNIKDILELSKYAARNTVESYKDLVRDVREFSARRKLYLNSQKISSACLSKECKSDDLHSLLTFAIDDYDFSASKGREIMPFKKKIDELWEKLEDRQNGKIVSRPFHIQEMNEFVEMEDGELVVVGGYSKRGKSIFLLSCVIDWLKKGESILVIDSELSDELYFIRLLSHISKVPFKIVKSGTGNEEQKDRILKAKQWLKTVNFYHEYLPIFDKNEIGSVFRRIHNSNPITMLVVDYFKADFSSDAYGNSTGLTGLANYVKNDIAGKYKIPVLGAVQMTENGAVSCSRLLVTVVSTLCWLDFKKQEEIANDGEDCGNAKLKITFNRNGSQMQNEDEYIDLKFEGDLISYTSADKQHIVQKPY